MPAREIITLPDRRLRAVSKPVAKVTAEVRALMDDMLATMYAAPGIGLAAVQVGEPKRLVVIDLAKDEQPKDPMFLVNPEIVWASTDKSEHEEGCLSIPEFFDMVARPSQVRVRFLDREGAPCEILAEGLLATVIQHEIDHLNGILFIDHLTKLKRDRVMKKFVKARRREKADV